MKADLRPGVSRTSQITVDRDRSIGFMGEDGRVYGTPYLVRDIEQTCRDLLLEYGDAGEDSVGTDIAIKHVAPTLLGMSVEIKVTVSAVDGRKVSFDVSAKDEVEPICSGTHGRFMVDVGKTIERLKAKAAKRTARAG
ncbi:LysR family transcriptional regulator [Bradyrhizobium sp.]|uniref:thioesterase family protein n=1 Tax=Bradyrhizobium sp. TaxID=376 RepID=UPI002399CE85|nr:LysR family transcriptional regulator [Bradyrhizobium sp.]MDE2376088.1 LysR family transcriptional regulator [Bradyrhizobium sp.]